MPITGSDNIKGNLSVEELAILYHDLKDCEGSRGSLNHAKEHGIADGYDSTREKAKGLIAKARGHNLDYFIAFDTCIVNLEEGYSLKSSPKNLFIDL